MLGCTKNNKMTMVDIDFVLIDSKFIFLFNEMIFQIVKEIMQINIGSNMNKISCM
jgi:hypothetical protein